MEALWLACALLVLLLAGCADVQKDYPQFGKKWDWWKYPAKKQETSEPSEDDAESGVRKHAGKKADPPFEPSTDPPGTDPKSVPEPVLPSAPIAPDDPAPASWAPASSDSPKPDVPVVSLEAHRRAVWKEARQLRDLDRLPPERKRQVLDHARASLGAWYKPMPMTRPDPEKEDWVTMVIWDFMPDEEFDRAAEGWRKIAEQEGVAYPEIPTRRDLPKLIRKIREKQQANIVRPALRSGEK